MKAGILPRANYLLLSLLLFLSVGTSAQAPGGVSTGLRLWLRADAGVTNSAGKVSAWADQSPGGNPVSQAVAGNQPTYYTTGSNLLNFNPTVYFTQSASNQLTHAGGMLGTGSYSAFNAFALGETVSGSINQGIFRETTTAGSGAVGLITYNGGNAQFLNGPVTASGLWGGIANIPYLWSGVDTTGGSRLYRNSSLVGSVSGSTSYTGNNGALSVGYAGTYYNGLLPELALYTGALTPNQVQNIQSYYAVKYALTLGGNYTASDSTVIWSLTTNSGYNNNITGIGRDDASALTQKQSQSVNSASNGNLLTVGLGSIAATNAAYTNTFPENKSYLIWGDNGGSVSSDTATGVTTDGTTTLSSLYGWNPLGRIWKAQGTGSRMVTKLVAASSHKRGQLMRGISKEGMKERAISCYRVFFCK